MSHTTENVLTKTYRGKFGNQVVYRNRNGVSIMAKLPKKGRRRPSKTQKQVRRKFKMASRWSVNARQDPEILAVYSKLASGMRTAHVMAMTNYLRPPGILSIGASRYTGKAGDQLSAVATDHFKVTGVTITITDAAGTVVETGPCREDLSADCWVYTATVGLPSISGLTVTAEATDIPCHTGSLEITLN